MEQSYLTLDEDDVIPWVDTGAFNYLSNCSGVATGTPLIEVTKNMP